MVSNRNFLLSSHIQLLKLKDIFYFYIDVKKPGVRFLTCFRLKSILFFILLQNLDTNQTIDIYLPADSIIAGQYMKKFKIGTNFKGIDTPDGFHVIHIESELKFVRLKNPNNIDYSFCFTTKYRGEDGNLVRVKYDSDKRCLHIESITTDIIDNHWNISEYSIEQKYRGAKPPARVEPNELLKIELKEEHFEELEPNLILSNLVKIRINDGP